MPNTRELRRRIKSVKNTAQITKAMQMVAATKMRRAQNQALSGRPYSHTLNLSLSSLLDRINLEEHKLLQKNFANKILVILLSTDKGLAGALNTNLLRATSQFINGKPVEFLTVGKKGRSFVARTGKDLGADFENHELVSSRQSRQIGKAAIDKFLAEEVGEVYLIYPHFVSALRQEPITIKLLPIDPAHIQELLGNHITKTEEKESHHDFIFEPGVDELLEFILIHSVETKIYQALLETKASEHSARMLAMQNATDNAKDLVEDLNLTYNQTRQDAITGELLEITSASLALE